MTKNTWMILSLLTFPVAGVFAVDSLGPGLTAMGAEQTANADNSIPAWDGGLPLRKEGHDAGGHYDSPFPDDKPLFFITISDIEKFKPFLSDGQQMLFKKQPTFKMPVYVTRRTAAYPEELYKRTQKNLSQAHLSASGNVVEGATGGGVPFPTPKTGAEVIWNSLLRYQGESCHYSYIETPVLQGGHYTLNRSIVYQDNEFNSLTKPDAQKTKNILTHFRQTILAPAKSAGALLLVHETVDQLQQPRTSWIYYPGARRVRLSPEVSYDTLANDVDGLRTYDDYNLYNGAIDRHDWKLVGKREMYVPYNAYKLVDKQVRYSQILQPGHLNPDYLRYEKHRVWVVEATLKKGERHLYHKRVFYIDEDTWGITLIDKYDANGALWRLAEGHSIVRQETPFVEFAPQVQYDFPSGRYLAMRLSNEEPVAFKEQAYAASYFTPSSLRSAGTR